METESDSDLITASACIIIMMAAIKMIMSSFLGAIFRREHMGAIGPPPLPPPSPRYSSQICWLCCVVYFATSFATFLGGILQNLKRP